MSARQPLRLVRLDAEVPRPEFSCGDDDIDEFFHRDSIDGCKELLCVTYAFNDADKTVAFFSVFNDSIKKEDCPRSAFRRLVKVIPFTKRYKSMPAAKIGRLGVSQDEQRAGHGTMILDYLKVWFTDKNKTGCRFLLVDAYNTDKAKAFYAKNGFQFLTEEDTGDRTRTMYFDLIRFAR